MIIIRDLLKYDTEKAIKIATFNNSMVLYKTNNDNWFTYEEINNNFNALSEEEAAEILGSYGRYELLEQYFKHLVKDA